MIQGSLPTEHPSHITSERLSDIIGSKIVINCWKMTCTVDTSQHSNNNSAQQELNVVYAGHNLKIQITAQKVKIPTGSSQASFSKDQMVHQIWQHTTPTILTLMTQEYMMMFIVLMGESRTESLCTAAVTKFIVPAPTRQINECGTLVE